MQRGHSISRLGDRLHHLGGPAAALDQLLRLASGGEGRIRQPDQVGGSVTGQLPTQLVGLLSQPISARPAEHAQLPSPERAGRVITPHQDRM